MSRTGCARLGRGFAAGPAGCRSCRRRSSSTSPTAATRIGGRTPIAALGVAALAAAADGLRPRHRRGAGPGALTATLKGGLGSASLVTEDGVTVGALAAVNAFGGCRRRAAGASGRAPSRSATSSAGSGRQRRRCRRSRRGRSSPGRVSRSANTTIAIVATDARSTRPARGGSPRWRMTASRGRSCRRTRPSTAISSLRSRRERGPSPGRSRRSASATQPRCCLARAIARGVHPARPMPGNLLPCWRELRWTWLRTS